MEQHKRALGRSAPAELAVRSLAAFLSTVGVLTLFGLLMGLIEGVSTRYLYQLLGWGGIVLTGFIGTPVHELCHWLMCKVFTLPVAEVALFRPVAGRTDGVLGYVNYSYNPSSLWQRLGCFFVGIAPMLLGTVVLLVLVRLLLPEAFAAVKVRAGAAARQGSGPVAVAGAVCAGFFAGLGQLRRWGILRGIVCLYLLLSISTHMTLSPADLRGASAGLVAVAALCICYALVSMLLGADAGAQLKKAAASVAALLSIGLAFATLSALVLCAVAHLL